MVDVLKGTDTLQQVTDVGAQTDKQVDILSGGKLRFNSTDGAGGIGTGYCEIINTATNDSQTFMRSNSTAMLTLNGNGIGIGTSTGGTTKAVLNVISTTKGVLLCVMTSAQKNAIAAPTEGLIVYDLTLHKLCVYTGAAWETFTSA